MQHKKIGARIKQRRIEVNISAAELAERLNMSRATVHRWECGDIRQIKLPVIEAIAKELNCNPAWLLGKADRKERASDVVGDRKYNDIGVMLTDVIQYIGYAENLTCQGKHVDVNVRNSIMVGLTAVRDMITSRYK